eukprot:3712472-Pyramimonas_sp.AAC.1
MNNARAHRLVQKGGAFWCCTRSTHGAHARECSLLSSLRSGNMMADGVSQFSAYVAPHWPWGSQSTIRDE